MPAMNVCPEIIICGRQVVRAEPVMSLSNGMIGLMRWDEVFPSILRQVQGERKNFTQFISRSYY